MDYKVFKDIIVKSYNDTFSKPQLDTTLPLGDILNCIIHNYFCTDLILDIYCEHFAFSYESFHSIAEKGNIYWSSLEPDAIDEERLNNVEEKEKIIKLLSLSKDKCKFSQKTPYNNLDKYEQDIHIPEYSKTYPGRLLCQIEYPLSTNETSSKKQYPNIYTYNKVISGTIIAKWKYMPFNPIYSSYDSRSIYYKNKDISLMNFIPYFSLSSIPYINYISEDNENSIDDIICHHLTDHFFNIYLFSQFVLLEKNGGVVYTDCAEYIHSSANTLTPLFKALQSLPTQYLKFYCLSLFLNFLHNNVSEKSKVFNYLNILVNKIYTFSNNSFITLKKSFIKSLVFYYNQSKEGKDKQTNTFKEIVSMNKSNLKRFISEHRQDYIDMRPELIDSSLILKLESIEPFLLNGLSKIFFN